MKLLNLKAIKGLVLMKTYLKTFLKLMKEMLTNLHQTKFKLKTLIKNSISLKKHQVLYKE